MERSRGTCRLPNWSPPLLTPGSRAVWIKVPTPVSCLDSNDDFFRLASSSVWTAVAPFVARRGRARKGSQTQTWADLWILLSFSFLSLSFFSLFQSIRDSLLPTPYFGCTYVRSTKYMPIVRIYVESKCHPPKGKQTGLLCFSPLKPFPPVRASSRGSPASRKCARRATIATMEWTTSFVRETD